MLNYRINGRNYYIEVIEGIVTFSDDEKDIELCDVIDISQVAKAIRKILSSGKDKAITVKKLTIAKQVNFYWLNSFSFPVNYSSRLILTVLADYLALIEHLEFGL